MTTPWDGQQGDGNRQPWQQQPVQGAGQWPQQAPGQWPPGPAGPAGSPAGSGTPTGNGRLLIGVAVGLVAAVLVGAVLVLTNVLNVGSDDTAAGPDTRPITLPATLGDVRDAVEVSKDKSKKPVDELAARYQRTYALTVKRYQQAFGGAAVAVRSYADADLMFLPTVIAVRAPSPGLINGPVPDLNDLELAASPSTPSIQQDGQVECYVASSQTVPKGKTVDPEDEFTSVCHRSSDTLTVYVHGLGRGPQGHTQMVKLTDAAFEAVAGAAT